VLSLCYGCACEKERERQKEREPTGMDPRRRRHPGIAGGAVVARKAEAEKEMRVRVHWPTVLFRLEEIVTV
jgi:hypothetical protein